MPDSSLNISYQLLNLVLNVYEFLSIIILVLVVISQ
jgi:hypothetical protein